MKRIIKEILSYVLIFVLVFGATKLINEYIAAAVKIDGQSMMATLEDNERMFMFKLPEVERFDIIVFPSPLNEKKYIKRVIGVPGDTIAYQNGELILNGQTMSEPYLAEMEADYPGIFTSDFTLEEVTGESIVPEGKFFVLGDNRRNSVDGRNFGFIEIDSVLGKTDFVYWPLSHLRLMDKYELNQTNTAIVPR